MDVEERQYRDLWQLVAKAKTDKEYIKAARAIIKYHSQHLADPQKQKLLPKLDKSTKPNLARCVLATMNELSDMELCGVEGNSTYSLATQALESYKKSEKKRVESLSAKKAYEKANRDYLDTLMCLFKNLDFKMLTPFQANTHDPLRWYLTGPGIIEICKNSGVELTLPTIRKYQGIGLIPKPIRLGRKGYYSLLTVLRVLIIDRAKKSGIKLTDFKKTINENLEFMLLKKYLLIFPDDRTWFEDSCAAMLYLTGPMERSYQRHLESKGDKDTMQKNSLRDNNEETTK